MNSPNPRAFDVTHRMILWIAVPMTFAYLTTPLLGIVDTAVIGQLGDAELLGGLAIGAILFDLVFTTFNFLRASTTGLVAQALGRADRSEQQAVFWRSLFISGVSGIAVIVFSPLLVQGGLWFMSPDPAVASATESYFMIRVLSGPAALGNYAILGYVLGVGKGVAGLVLQSIINLTNIVLSIWLGLVLGWGIEGVAWGTVIGEVIGALIGLVYVLKSFDADSRLTKIQLLDSKPIRQLLALNGDIMIRSFCLLAAFALFTRIGSSSGTVLLAANAVLMNIFFVAGYYLDGFANAVEQLVGRAIGARYLPAFNRVVKLCFYWSLGLALVTTLFFLFLGDGVIALMTTSIEIREAAGDYLIWAALTAVAGALAFLMDGVFIGATWSRDMRNTMLFSLLVFVVLSWLFQNWFGNHGLWLAFNLFLFLRGISLAFLLPARREQTFPV